MVRTMVEKTLSYKDTVYLLLNRRIVSSIRQQLNNGRFRRDSLSSSGLDVVQGQLEKLSKRVFLLAKHNRSVYAPWYDEIIRDSLGSTKPEEM